MPIYAMYDSNVEKRAKIINDAYKKRLEAVRTIEQERARILLSKYREEAKKQKNDYEAAIKLTSESKRKAEILKAIEDFEQRMQIPDAHTEAQSIRDKVMSEDYIENKTRHLQLNKQLQTERFNEAMSILINKSEEQERIKKAEDARKQNIKKIEIARAKSAVKKHNDFVERRAKFFEEQHKRDFPELYNDDGTLRRNRRFLEVFAEEGVSTPVYSIERNAPTVTAGNDNGFTIRNPQKSEYYGQNYEAGCYSKFNENASEQLKNENELNIVNGAFVMANNFQANAVKKAAEKAKKEQYRNELIKRIILKNSIESKQNDALADEGIEILNQIQQMRLQ